MPIDRAAALRNAEKLIRQGKLDAAIAEYVRLVDDQPRDWNMANALGDLYVRAGQLDKAIQQFNQIAESLSEEGAVAKASAVYKKILKLKPDHEHALLQVSDILASQGLYADARSHMNTVIEQRRARGDVRGAAQVRIRLGALDPQDISARRLACDARVEIGDIAGAVRDLKEIAADLVEKARGAESLDVLLHAATLDAHDSEVRERLLDAYLLAGDLAKAKEYATSVEQFRLLAAAFEGQGRPEDALALLRHAAALHPSDIELRGQLARTFLEQGDVATAAEYLTVEIAGDDPELLLMLAIIQLRGSAVEEGLAIVRGLLDQDLSRGQQIVRLGVGVAERWPDTGFRVVEVVSEAAVARADWTAASAALQQFVSAVPYHVPSLMRLVEICVDGGLDAMMTTAQAQLADAYITSGAAVEARFIAEDLLIREPWDLSNIERLRRSLVLLGEADPDSIIAERLSGELPLSAGDLSLEPEVALSLDGDGVDALPVVAGADEVSSLPTARATSGARGQFELSANAIDLAAILGELESPTAGVPSEPAHAEAGSVEVDLSVVLSDIKRPAVPIVPPPEPAIPATVPEVPASVSTIEPSAPESPAVAVQPQNLDGVFEQLRGEVSQDTASEEAEASYRKALALRAAGDVDGCISALEAASRAPALRFATASLLGRMLVAGGKRREAFEWFERATQAPAPTPDDAHALLNDFADALEAEGESGRALAVCLELQAQASAYRDIATRVERLTRAQAGG